MSEEVFYCIHCVVSSRFLHAMDIITPGCTQIDISGQWSSEFKQIVPSGIGAEARIGYSVEVDGSLLVVGA